MSVGMDVLVRGESQAWPGRAGEMRNSLNAIEGLLSLSFFSRPSPLAPRPWLGGAVGESVFFVGGGVDGWMDGWMEIAGSALT